MLVIVKLVKMAFFGEIFFSVFLKSFKFFFLISNFEKKFSKKVFEIKNRQKKFRRFFRPNFFIVCFYFI